MSEMYYRLDGHAVVPGTQDDFIRYYETPDGNAERVVRKDVFGNVTVSTVFLCLDHGWGGGAPVVFETMVFVGNNDTHQERYSTWDEAEAGHLRAFEEARQRQANFAAAKPRED